MADQVVYLSTDDLAILKDVIARVRGTNTHPPSRPPTERSWDEAEDHQAPETFIAKPVEEDGIIEFDDSSGENRPGWAQCNIYRIDRTTDPPTLHETGVVRRVWNVSRSRIESEEFIVVVRDKYGNYMAPTGGGGGNIVRVEIEEVEEDPDTEEKVAICVVLSKSCGVTVKCEATDAGSATINSSPARDGFPRIRVHDQLGCLFNEEALGLVGRAGYAAYMEALEDTNGTAFGTASSDMDGCCSGCCWEMISLCCAETGVGTGTDVFFVP